MKPCFLRCLLAVGALASSLVAVAQAQNITSELNGRLVSLKGRTAVAFPGNDLAQAKYIALFYSAGWCPPCHAFTPELVRFYNEMKPKHPEFEIIFMSDDHSESEMQNYMREMSMPWPAVRYSFAKSSRNLNKFAGPGIPCLVLLDQAGKVISHSYAGENYLGPQKVVKDLAKLLAAEPATMTSASAATPAGSTIKSPSGTNWDEAFKKRP